MDLSRLNPAQREAVCHGNTPLLVLAGAGTGKTMVITYRIAQLIENGLRPNKILAVTFTNKAAREMRERAADLCGLPLRALTIGTFHATCARLLRQFGQHLGLDPHFVIYDQADQLTLIKRCAKELGISKDLVDPRTLRSLVERWKNDGWLPDEVRSDHPFADQGLAVYKLYERKCREANGVDFGGLLVNAYALLRKVEEVKRACRWRWSHLLVDEYQDTNLVQAAVVKQLVTDAHSLTVVGDDDQSIYSWRGANVGNIQTFEREYPGATLIRLERNYRSTQTILDAANAVIAHNVFRKGKNLYTRDRAGTTLELCQYDGELAEGEGTGEAISAWLQNGMDPTEIAILYRINAQSRSFEDALRRRQIPYAVYGGIRFYDRKEIKDALAYLRLINNPRSDVDFIRAIGTPARGIGKTTLDRLDALASDQDIPLFEAAVAAVAGAGGITPRPRKQLAVFVELITRLNHAVSSRDPKWLLEQVLDDSGYLAALEKDDSEEATERRENLRALLGGIDEYLELSEEPSLASYLEEVSLITDLDNMSADTRRVSLMTLHSAKGLEFESVFLTGLEEGLFPHNRSIWDPESLEEERRLFYVGITRAKSHLTLSLCDQRFVSGGWGGADPSRFLAEVPPDLLSTSSRQELAAPSQYESDPCGFAPGMRVFHNTYGEGDVLSVDGVGKRQTVTVMFGGDLKKTVVTRYVQRR